MNRHAFLSTGGRINPHRLLPGWRNWVPAVGGWVLEVVS
ncbi:hypothetical protein [Alloactinosynnema sp. L-07]|nr:hypothetical protein [Alloactinosynnema sp. L-07]